MTSMGGLGPVLGSRYSYLLNSSLHYVNFEKNGFNDIDETEMKFRELSLSKGEYLYIPNSNPISIMNPATQGGDENSSSSATFLRACVVDASNLNLFRENLEKYQNAI